MLHLTLILLHAVAALIALGAGIYAWLARVEDDRLRWALWVYLAGLVGLTVFVVAAVAAEWADKGAGERAMDGVLFALALYMIWRGARARAELRRLGSGWHRRYMRGIGFTLVALWVGFVIIGVLDLGAPIWLVVVAGVLAVAVGHRVERTVEARRSLATRPRFGLRPRTWINR